MTESFQLQAWCLVLLLRMLPTAASYWLTVPAVDARNWVSRDEVGLYYDQKLHGGGSLRMMVEKDFQCIDGPPEEIDPAGYPNPLAPIGIKRVND
jgi:hypothetical protein